MRIHRHGGKATHAARDDAQPGAQHHLSQPMLAQTGEEAPFGMDVDQLDHQHHDDDQARDQEAVAQHIDKQIQKIVHHM